MDLLVDKLLTLSEGTHPFHGQWILKPRKTRALGYLAPLIQGKRRFSAILFLTSALALLKV